MINFFDRCLNLRFAAPTPLIWVIVCCTLTGCGASQEEMLIRAAQRRRAPDRSEADSAKNTKTDQPRAPLPGTQQNTADQKAKQSSDFTSTAGSKPKLPSSATSTPPHSEATFSISPIEKRQPNAALSENARRKISQRNILTLATGLRRHFADTKRLPRSYTCNSDNLPTLSWRVALLPYLGHEDLHEKFDFTKPWNVEPNKSLLKYIPDAFVSPERFDTNTNYLLPAGKHFIFGENRVPREKTIEDGMGNTIMLFEVNDELAVPWTKPMDLKADNIAELSAAIGGVRNDGTFAAWASGQPVLLSNTLTSEEIFHATTHESGEAFRAGDIHCDIPLKAQAKSNSSEPLSHGDDTFNQKRIATSVRQNVPSEDDISGAQKKLRNIYVKKLRDAKEYSDKTKLARSMLSDAAKSQSDPVGTYVMQTAAMRLALETVDIDLLLAAIDQRIARFDVDPYLEHLNWLQQISASRLKPRTTTLGNKKLSERALIVAYIGIMENDFSQAEQVIGIAYQFTSKKKDDLVPRLMNKLRVSLSAAENRFKEALSDLDTYRKNPDDAEAATKFGMFLCFTKGDWDTGLALLNKSENKVLQEIAHKDQQTAANSTALEHAALADMWWDLGERAKSLSHRRPCRERALHWYLQAYQQLPDSLDRIHVKSRIEGIDSLEVGSLVALSQQLARVMRFELSNPRSQLTATVRSQQTNDDD